MCPGERQRRRACRLLSNDIGSMRRSCRMVKGRASGRARRVSGTPTWGDATAPDAPMMSRTPSGGRGDVHGADRLAGDIWKNAAGIRRARSWFATSARANRACEAESVPHLSPFRRALEAAKAP